MLVADNPFLEQPSILSTPPFPLENSERPLFGKF